MKIERVLWRTNDGALDLLAYEPLTGKILLFPYSVDPAQLIELRRACDDCLANHSLTRPSPPQPLQS